MIRNFLCSLISTISLNHVTLTLITSWSLVSTKTNAVVKILLEHRILMLSSVFAKFVTVVTYYFEFFFLNICLH